MITNGHPEQSPIHVPPLGIAVHDHIIVGRNADASLKGMKLM